ncbi:MAG TPA: glycerol-3-phosphate dehydrogenase/oxidase [Candidatus Polarisedimenticolaceae bacterium]|nr:glycerol-3-phosphate dehydrogenase/oxidase [Candidatus Polarisedimenticolaceae bacterium]
MRLTAVKDGIFGCGRRDGGGAIRESIGDVATFDLAVVGGGITGCAAARDAAARGLTTVLLEQHDLAQGTSSRSTKLLHGGLRYLEHGDLRLVRQALREREVTARLAPSLATPLRFVVPVWPGRPPSLTKVRLGVALYELLARRSSLPRGGAVSAAEIARVAPQLAPGPRGGVAFFDRQTDDARLTLAIAEDARRRGATIRTRVALTGLSREGDAHELACRDEGGTVFPLRARSVLNASGAWADEIRSLAGRTAPLLRTSRGAHLVLRGVSLSAAVLLAGERPGHRLFAIPWRGATLFGTTDIEDDGVPERELPVADDLRLLFREARRHFPSAGLTRAHVLSAFTGVRPLVRGGGETLRASREHEIHDEDGLVTIVGGKLTTWRVMAIDAIDAVVRRLGLRTRSPQELLTTPLPAGDDTSLAFVRHAEDVVFRRIGAGHDPHEVRRLLPGIVATLSERLAWSAATAAAESERVLAALGAMERRLDDALSPE